MGPRHNLRATQRRPRSLPAAKAQPQRRERPAPDLEQVPASLAAAQSQVHRLQRLGAPRQTPWPSGHAPARAVGLERQPDPRGDRLARALRGGPGARPTKRRSHSPCQAEALSAALARSGGTPLRAEGPGALRHLRAAHGGQPSEGLQLVSLSVREPARTGGGRARRAPAKYSASRRTWCSTRYAVHGRAPVRTRAPEPAPRRAWRRGDEPSAWTGARFATRPACTPRKSRWSRPLSPIAAARGARGRRAPGCQARHPAHRGAEPPSGRHRLGRDRQACGGGPAQRSPNRRKSRRSWPVSPICARPWTRPRERNWIGLARRL